MTGAMNTGVLGVSLISAGFSILFWGPSDEGVSKPALTPFVQMAEEASYQWKIILGGLIVVGILLCLLPLFAEGVEEKIHELIDRPKGNLKVRILKARNLVNNKHGGVVDYIGGDKKPNTFVRATVDATHHDTPTVKGSFNPDYAAAARCDSADDSPMEWVFENIDVRSNNHTVKLEMFDAELHLVGNVSGLKFGGFTKQEFMLNGSAELDIKDFAKAYSRWVHKDIAISNNGKDQGMLDAKFARGIIEAEFFFDPH